MERKSPDAIHPGCGFVTFDEFLGVLQKAVEDDESSIPERKSGQGKSNTRASASGSSSADPMDTSSAPVGDSSNAQHGVFMFEVGDKVEVSVGYDRYGDAASGPLRPGDRGTVLEVQRGPRGDRQSVRVLFGGRRWWYQPQALLSERSGLVESPAVRFLTDLLRAHGYDSNLRPLWGKPVLSSSWKIGDLVVPVSNASEKYKMNEISDDSSGALTIGRVVAEGSSMPKRESGMVTVEFANEDVGRKRVKVSSLLHTNFFYGTSVRIDAANDLTTTNSHQSHEGSVAMDIGERVVADPQNEHSNSYFSSMASDSAGDIEDNNAAENSADEKTEEHDCIDTESKKKISAVAKLDKTAMSYIIKECKTSLSLARLFAAGLPDAILEGISHASKSDVNSSAVSSLGSLSVAVIRQLFPEPSSTSFASTDELEGQPPSISGAANPLNSDDVVRERTHIEESTDTSLGDALAMSNSGNRRNRTRESIRAEIRSNSVNVRDLVRDLGVGAEQRRGVLLALMASARMHDDPRSLGRLPDSFGRLSAEAAAFSFPPANQDQEDNFPSANHFTSSIIRPDSFPSQPMSRSSRRANNSSSSSGSRRSMSASTNSLINDGLLLNSLSWVKKALSAGAVVKSHDEEDNSILLLAVSLGCSTNIISMLIRSGCTVGKKELEEASRTGQADVLETLLQQTVYSEGSIDTLNCSDAVVEVLANVVQKQRRQEEAMRDSAVNFAGKMLKSLVEMTLKFRIEGKDDHSSKSAKALVGEVLLHAMHQSQNQALEVRSMASNEAAATDDGRVPAFPTTLSSASGNDNAGSDTLNKANIRRQFSLIDILPPSVFHAACSKEQGDGLTSYLRLTENYFWSKEIKDVVVGLTLACSLLRKASPLCAEMRRYGVKEVAAYHEELADEALAEINSILNQNNVSGDQEICPVVKCPKKHTTILHLTRHSSFRCDLCGKGVEQGKPMYGCRECDWDACESCTDKAEGGLVKWKNIQLLSVEFQEKISIFDCPDNESMTVNENHPFACKHDELQNISNGIRRKESKAIQDLGEMLDIPGKVTLYEFATYILPTLHSALIGGNINQDSLNITPGVIMATSSGHTGRRSKKPRVGGSSRKKRSGCKSSKYPSHKGYHNARNRRCGDQSSFYRSLALLLQTHKEKQQEAAVASNGGEDTDETLVVEEDEMNVVSSNEDQSTSSPPTTFEAGEENHKILVPEILRRLHAILAFHERVVVTKHKHAAESGGELQSLLQPFEIELRRLPDSADQLHTLPFGNNQSQSAKLKEKLPFLGRRLPPSESCTDLQGAVVHIEPLMPLGELHFHILRSCRVLIPEYRLFCRKLVQDRCIIVERPAKSFHAGQKSASSSDKMDESWRIARIIAFNEKTGAHKVRYASHMLSHNSNLCDAEEELLHPGSYRTISDQLEFNGRESMMILAARDYCILHRYRHDDGGFVMDYDNSIEEMMSEVRSHELDFTDDGTRMDQYSSRSAVGDMNLSDMGSEKKEAVSDLMLPIGTRVESNVHADDGWNVYTIISSYFEVTGIANILNEDIESLTSQLKSSIRPTSASDLDSSSEVMLGKFCRYGLVSETGEVILGVPGNKIRGHDASLHQRRTHQQRGQGSWRQFPQSESSEPSNLLRGHSIFDRGISIASVRRASSSGAINSERSEREGKFQKPAVGVLRRTWSALSPLQSMCPLELNGSNDENHRTDDRSGKRRTRKLSIGGNDVEISVDLAAMEQPPILTIELSLDDSQPTTSLPILGGVTLFSGLSRLRNKRKSGLNKALDLDRKCKVFYTVSMQWGNGKGNFQKHLQQSKPLAFTPPWLKRRLDVNNPYNFVNEQYSVQNHEFSLNEISNDAGLGSDEFVNTSDPVTENEMDVSISTAPDGLASHDSWSTLNGNPCNKSGDGIDISLALGNCDGLNEISVQCLQLMNFFVDALVNYVPESCEDHHSSSNGGDISLRQLTEASFESPHVLDEDSICAMFVSEALTGKLLEQLDDPLSVVGGALPDWCSVAPAFAPRVFSHESRRRLLERAAFGVSRAALRQQEAKVAVAPLRQRMAALRGRAVELVSEAFSGGAADPTALQLQADELYGMEETLANRVNAAFRAQSWDERSLQCAKAAVRREHLLSDAAAVMHKYACDTSVNRRRLEVRFEGESGFDAASGDEAGVTRGFYADVAEVLLNCDFVAGVYPSSTCISNDSRTIVNDNADDAAAAADRGSVPTPLQKLPLWIPDIDASGRVIIPTPRANPRSGIGVFPRPLGLHSPLRASILDEFRFMGRLFAAAMRDGFVFPLPLSVSFLKLVQSLTAAGPIIQESLLGNRILRQQHSIGSSNSSMASDYFSNHNSSVPSSVASSPVPNMSIDDGCILGEPSALDNISTSGEGSDLPLNVAGDHSHSSFFSSSDKTFVLNSDDLPRPGFLGGEIYAVEHYICTALDKLDEIEHELTDDQLLQRRQDIASDKAFARNALGKSYDCSFEDYFEGKTFVDPLDPGQNEDAVQLCPDGAKRPVTIDNIREWVFLAKQFFLHDGVIAQAIAFRNGVNDFFSADALLLLTAQELQRDVCGCGDNVDNWDEDSIRALFKLDGGKGAAEALVAVAAMGGEGGAALSRRFGPSSPTVGYLVKALIEATPTQRRQFLSFVTSVPIVTPGQIEIVPIVSPAGEFLPMSDPTCLPRANTCARRLYLPKFESYEPFSQVFFAVVREESRFKGFYEWRG